MTSLVQGAVMFLFEGACGRVLHTGDFRCAYMALQRFYPVSHSLSITITSIAACASGLLDQLEIA